MRGQSGPILEDQTGGYQPPATNIPIYNTPAYQAPPSTNQNATPGYSAPQSYPAPASPSGQLPDPYSSAIAPGASQAPYAGSSSIAPGVEPTPGPGFDSLDITAPAVMGHEPIERLAPIDVYVQEARTGRVILGGAVNSDLGVSGQLVIEERNFDLFRVPRTWDEVWSGRAFRGGGQNFRAELMPGSQVQRYTVNWTEPNLFDLPYSLSVGGFLYTRQFRDWTEQRLGGRVALGYEITKDLAISSELRMEDVNIFDPRLAGIPQLDAALGSNDVYRGRWRLVHDTRDNPFMSTRGGMTELIYDQVFGEYDYSRGQINMSRYFTVRERADGGGRHTLASTMKLGFSGSQTPIFENFFAGGYSTMRGFSFRGASPVVGDVQVGGQFSMLGSLEYVMPLTADEMLRAVAFVDYGTVEQNIEIDWDNFRVAPGFGFRVAVPALGPAPLAFDFAFPVAHADTDDRQVFSFFMGLTRN
ncbi:MAG: BamA/TamA family outer membrane protein [Aureliella sp.]